MKTITARELRNEYARILRELENTGEGYTITNHGRPVARITPIAPVPDRLRAFSGVPLSSAASLNSAAGPFNHSEFDRETTEVLDPVARDPYAGRSDEPGTEAVQPSRPDGSNSTAEAHGNRVAPNGPRLGDLPQQIAQERLEKQ